MLLYERICPQEIQKSLEAIGNAEFTVFLREKQILISNITESAFSIPKKEMVKKISSTLPIQ